MILTQGYLHKILKYDPDTGEWIWLRSLNSRVEVGQAAGTISFHGYRIITIGGVKFRSGRLAWLYMTGEWPEDEIDHENQVKLDDRWENLRNGTRSENGSNRSLQANNTSGAIGVYWNFEKSKWCAQVKKNQVVHHIGYFNSFEEAVAARDSAAESLHGDFVQLNSNQGESA